MSVDFPLIAPNNLVKARVAVWRPVEDDQSGDIAVLSIISERPSGLIPARLVSGDDFWEHPFRAFGFPRGYDHGVWVAGVLRAPQGFGWVQMEGTASGYAVEGGFSGGAVWDDDLAGVVGMTVAADLQSGIRTAYLIPADTLVHAWPPLAQQTLPPSPYRGLYSFRTQDVAVFFGREDLTSRLIREVAYRPIVALVGPSGSGKSSVLFAGLLPKLLQQPEWITVSMRPAQAMSPVLSLSAAFLELLESDLSETERLTAMRSLATLIVDGHLPEVINRVLTRAQANHLLLAVDQFEEVFARDAADVVEFTHVLLSAVQAQTSPLGPRLTVVLTLRADFLNNALQDPAMAAALEDSVITIGQMGRSQLRSVIEGPLPAGVRYESGLVDRILGDVGEEPGSLPLLEFALTLLWERQERGVLSHATYEQLGGVGGALAAYAERVYSEQLLPEDRDHARRLFIQLARPSDVGTPVRRIARPSELGEVRWQLAQRLAATRLLVTDRDPTGMESVELVHEALITGWARLSEWIEEDRAFRSWQEQLRNSLSAWENVNRDAGAMLRGAPLAEAERWLSDREDDLAEAERNFIRLGIAYRGRSVRRLRVAVITLTMLLLASVGLGGVVVWQSGQSDKAGRIAGSRDLANKAEFLADSDPRTAMLLAATAYKMYPTSESVRMLTRVAGDYRQLGRVLTTDLPPITGTLFSPVDPNLLAIYGYDYVAIWDIRTNSRRAMHGFGDRINVYGFTPDGKALLVGRMGAGRNVALLLWKHSENRIDDLSAIDPFPEESSPDGIKFSRDGTLFAICVDSRVQVWELQTQSLLSQTPEVDSASNGCGVGFTTNKDLLYVDKGKVVIWGSRTGKAVSMDTLYRPASETNAPRAAVAPNGQTALIFFQTAPDDNGSAVVWDVSKRARDRAGWSSSIDAEEGNVDFTSDGRLAIISSFDGFMTMDVRKRQILGTFAGMRDVASVSPDGVAAASALAPKSVALVDLTARLGLPSGGGQVATLKDASDRAVHLAEDEVAVFSYDIDRGATVSLAHKLPALSSSDGPILSPDGRHVAANLGNRIILLDPGRPAAPRTLHGHSRSVRSLRFDPSGSVLVSIDDSEFVVWSVATGKVAWRRSVSWKFSEESEGDLVAASPNGQNVATVDGAGIVEIWKESSRDSMVLAKNANAVSFSASGDWLAVGSATETQLWDMRGKPKFVRSISGGGYIAAVFSDDDAFVAVSSIVGGRGDLENAGIDVFRTQDGQLAGSVGAQSFFGSGGGWNVAFLPNRQEVLMTDPAGVRVLSFDPAYALREICRITDEGRLSGDEWDQYASGFKYVASCR